MGFFTQLYIAQLKSHPVATNLATALVLMTAGDVMAQELERYKLDDFFAGANPDLEGLPQNRRLTLRRYGTQRNHPHQAGSIWEEEEEYKPPGPPSNLRYDGEESTSDWPDAAEIISKFIWNEAQELDYVRMSSMSGWAVGFYTPAYMWLYGIYDKVFPRKTTWTVFARVMGSLVYSVPVNAAFFTYGTGVHHTMEWLAIRREWRDELYGIEDEDEEEDLVNIPRGAWHAVRRSSSRMAATSSKEQDKEDEDAREERLRGLHRGEIQLTQPKPPPYDWAMMLSKSQLKIESELVSTVSRSAMMWIPINMFNFAIMPPHLRPVALMFFSVFWNCYLSLVQHRDVPLPEDV